MERLPYRDMEGNSISFEKWIELFGSIDRIINKQKVNGFLISTVWLGIEHLGSGKLNIFETMVFNENGDDIHIDRYDTKEEAILGHNRVVRLVLEGKIGVIND